MFGFQMHFLLERREVWDYRYNPFLNHPILSWGWKNSVLNKKTHTTWILFRDLCKLARHSLELVIYFVLLWFHQKENTVLAENQYVNVKYYYSANNVSIFNLQFPVKEEKDIFSDFTLGSYPF